MIYYTIGKNKDISGKHYYSLDLFSSKKAVLLFAEKENLNPANAHKVVAVGNIDLAKKEEHFSGWQPELGDSLKILREWARHEANKAPPPLPLIVTEPDGSQWVALEDYLKIAGVSYEHMATN